MKHLEVQAALTSCGTYQLLFHSRGPVWTAKSTTTGEIMACTMGHDEAGNVVALSIVRVEENQGGTK